MPEPDRSDITYDKAVAEVAVDLHLNEETLREAFSVWLHGRGCVHPSLPVSPYALGTYEYQPGGWTPKEGVSACP